MPSLRYALIAVPALIAASPVAAQDMDAAAEALALIGAHRVSMQIPCTVPIPPGPYASQWQQETAWQNARNFGNCLDDVMAREQGRLADLTADIDRLQASASRGSDWSMVEAALDAKWDELDTLEDKIRNRARWAETAVNVVNILTPAPPADPMFPSFLAGSTPFPYYRRDSSVSAPGIR